MRLIDADYVKSKLNKAALGGHVHYYVCGVIDDAPTIEAETVKHGRWKEKLTVVYCSCCRLSWSKCFKESLRRTYKYCPNCGARMDGENE